MHLVTWVPERARPINDSVGIRSIFLRGSIFGGSFPNMRLFLATLLRSSMTGQ